MIRANNEAVKDVIVIGGGMAGVSAAMSAGEEGADVLLIEQQSYLGGTATGGLVVPLMVGGIYTQDKRKIVSGNLDRIFSRIERHGDARGYNYNPEIIKCVLDDMMTEHNVEILFNTFIYDVEVKDKKIKNIFSINKSGVTKYGAKVFIDTSGDADVAYKSGVLWEMGRKSDGLTQAVTLRFTLGNVDVDRARGYMRSDKGRESLRRAIKEYTDNTGFEILDSGGFQNFVVGGRPNELVFNCPRIIGADATDSASMTRAYITGRRKILVYYKLLKENIPGCENAFISNIASLIGIRESRRIQGEYVLTGDDVVGGRKFDDGIACNSWYIDIHNPKGTGILSGQGNSYQGGTYPGSTAGPQYPRGGWNDIPFRCLYSNEVKNLLVAGRCISTTHEAQAAVRIMASCIATGQAAGTAAALMAKNNQVADLVDVDALRRRLSERGALITGINL